MRKVLKGWDTTRLHVVLDGWPQSDIDKGLGQEVADSSKFRKIDSEAEQAASKRRRITALEPVWG